jgi:hypothetical protein
MNFTELNEVYRSLNDLTKEICLKLKEFNYQYKKGFYNNHSIRVENEFIAEAYPIPVITVNGKFDIGVDLNMIFIEAQFPASIVNSFDFNKFTEYEFDVYGTNDYNIDFYNVNMEINGISSRISIYLNKNINLAEVINVINLFNTI